MQYIKPSSNSVVSYESRDCTVRALASASGCSYARAYAIMERAGREENSGMSLNHINEAMKYVGANLVGVFGTTIAATYLRNITNADIERGMELKNFIKYFQTGRYFVLIRGHALAVVDGELMDSGCVKAGVYVVAAWKF